MDMVTLEVIPLVDCHLVMFVCRDIIRLAPGAHARDKAAFGHLANI